MNHAVSTSPWAVLVACGAAALIVGLATTDLGPYLPLFLLAIGYMAWSFRRPAVAIVTIVLMHAYLFERSSEISTLEVGVGVYLYSYLGYWFLTTSFVRRERILIRTSEKFLMGFIVMCYASGVLLIAGGSRVDYWHRECIAISMLLLCFPAREAMRTKSGVVAVFGSFALLVTSLAIVNLVQYRASSLAANYFWELYSGRKPFGSALYAALAIGALSLRAHLRQPQFRMLALVLAITGALALGTTFYRGFWLAAILGVLVLFFLIDRREKLSLLWTMTGGVVLAAVLGFLLVGNLGPFIVEALWNRLVSSGSAMTDISVTNRLAETRTVMALVVDSPLVGHGMGYWFSHFNIITRTTQELMYVHNAYVYLLLKVGILGLALFGGYYLLVLRDGIRISRAGAGDPLDLAMVRATVAILISYLFVATNSGILQDKQVLLIVTLGTAIITSRQRE
ncbi:MAG: O-antigen ligase family protein [Bacteroidetes bacterium]|nr:O-antigen ligase family protein [Bacteroidota bacterium]